MIAAGCSSDCAMRFDELCPGWLCEGELIAWWADWLPEDAMLRLAIYAAVTLGVITLSMMFLVLLLSEAASWRERRRRQFNEQWRPFFALCCITDELPHPVPPLPKGDRLWLLLQWNRTQLQLRGTGRERMNRALDALQLEPFALRLLEGGVRSRLIGLTCLRYVADMRHWQAVEQLLALRSSIVSLAAAQTLVAIDAQKAMKMLLPMSLARSDWALPRLSSLCQQAGSKAVTPFLLSTMLSSTEAERGRLAPLLLWAEPRLTGPWARNALEDEQTPPEQLEIALKCLTELNDPRDRSRLMKMFDHPDGSVRTVAIQAFKQQARLTDAPLILPYLADANWNVRQSSADALATLPGITDEYLQQLLAAVTDRYGRDALQRAIAEANA